jgi:ketosteroid isomerase-like protein
VTDTAANAREVLDRLVRAVNSRDLEALVVCFAEDYVNETPAHPGRDFRGRDQVRRNWVKLFGGVPDLTGSILRATVDGPALWSEWELAGTRLDGGPFLMRGVVIYDIEGGTIRGARFFLEPVEYDSGDIEAATSAVAGPSHEGAAGPGEGPS